MTSSQLCTPGGTEPDHPMSLGVHGRYPGAQHGVDYLADQGFAVTSVEIVGTGHRSVERVTGPQTRGKATTAGALLGPWIGLFVGLAFSLFGGRSPSPVRALL